MAVDCFVPIVVDRAAAERYGKDAGNVTQKDHNSRRNCSPIEVPSLEDIDIEEDNGESETCNACTPEEFGSPKHL